jgi:hypothetical protein
MMNRLLAIVATTFLITSAFSSYNDKVLDSVSGGFCTKIQSGISISRPMIDRELNFVYGVDDIEEEYKNFSRFEELYRRTTSAEDTTQEFQIFAQNCRELYQSLDLGSKDGIAVHMLFERVAEKYADIMKRFKKHKERMEPSADIENRQRENMTYGDADRIFAQFGVDSLIKIH